MSETILIATLMRPEGETGVQTHFRAFMAYLAKQGVSVELVTPYSAPRWQVYPAFALRRLIDPVSRPLSVWWYRAGHAWFLRAALRRRLADGKPCVIYAQCPPSAAAALAARASAQQRVVMVVHFNLSQADEWLGKGMLREGDRVWRGIRKLEAEVLPRLDGLVFVSRFMRESLLARIPDMGKVPYAVVPNFVDDPGAPAPLPPEADLIAVGTLEARKNQSYLLDVLAAAREHGHRYTLTLVGDGPDRAVLEKKAHSLGLSEQVRFAGFVSNAAHWMARHRACIHAARMENLPITLIEAMAHGRPVVAPAVGGIPEVFDDGVEGMQLPLDQADEAANVLIAFLSDAESCERAGAAARNRFLERFDTRVAARTLFRFLTERNAV